ncbi:MAG: PilZ domain-containing protein [Myxococcota bacterium]
MQTGQDPRFRKRLPCRLAGAEGARAGMVLNVSRGGLFVQTGAVARPGDAVRIDLEIEAARSLAVEASVIWRRVVGAHLRAVQVGGFGARIQHAPDGWFEFLAGLAGSEVPPLPVEVASGQSRYRVRLRLAGSPRTRSLVVESPDADTARRRAVELAGPQWVVLDLNPELRDA